MRRIVFLLLLVMSGLPPRPAEVGASGADSPWRLYLEIDQMFVLKVGAEYRIAPRWAIKAAAGASVFSIATLGYEVLGVYRLSDPAGRFRCDIEFGLPLAYANPFEGRVIDWDEHIDDPFFGFAPGIGIAWGYRFAAAGTFAVKTGAVVAFEHQRDRGWRDPFVLPEVAVSWYPWGNP